MRDLGRGQGAQLVKGQGRSLRAGQGGNLGRRHRGKGIGGDCSDLCCPKHRNLPRRQSGHLIRAEAGHLIAGQAHDGPHGHRSKIGGLHRGNHAGRNRT